MSRIFISHSSKDHAATQQMVDWLRDEQKFESYFLDSDPAQGLVAARSWEEQLLRKLRFCRLFLAIVTASWVESKWCFAEYTHARLRGKPVFLVKHDTCELPPEMSVDQYVDVAVDRSAGLDKLAHGLREADADPRGVFGLAPGRPIYPGLLSFEEEDAAVFFGRDDAVDACLGKLEALPLTGGLLLIIGPSGSGKSSLLKAGILPLLQRQRRQWCVLPTFRPGADPIAAFARSVAHASGDDHASHSVDDLSNVRLEPETAARLFTRQLHDWRATRSDHVAPILVSIDQLEECLDGEQRLVGDVAKAQHEDRATARRFVELLARLLASREGIIAVATIRSDSLAAFQRLASDLAIDPQTFLVDPIERSALYEVIEGPAERAEIDLEPGFAGRLVDDVQSGEALPLLAFTLQQLHRRYGGDQVLRVEEYERLGGVSGAVETHANGLLPILQQSDEVRSIRVAFLALVQVDEGGRPRKRAARWADIAPDAQAVLQRFVEARLLVRKEETVEVAHEALLEYWPRLRGWIDGAKGALQTVRQAASAAAEWDATERPERLRWSDERSVEAILAYERLHAGPTPGTLEHAFLRPVTTTEMFKDLEKRGTTHEARASIGVRLALLGDLRPGISWAEHGPDLVWCDVPDGVVRLYNPGETPADAIAESREDGWLSTRVSRELPPDGLPFEVGAGVQITKYPITWAQFRPFLEALDGARDDRWWFRSDVGDRQMASPAPHMDNRPASGVSWYTALAYSRWVGERLGYEVRLPYEWEWQQAATGGDQRGRRYPWGLDWDPNRTNTWESGLRRTTAVGMYPQAASPIGVMDMAGNAWEWCLNTYKRPTTEPDLASREMRVVKGASCIVDGKKNSRTHYAGKLDPMGAYVTCFRLVRVVAASGPRSRRG